jgi:hypothetical protein
VIERVLSFISVEEVEEIGRNIEKIIKQRDAIVSQIYRTRFFLATLLILVFLIEINLVKIPSTVWGVRLNFDQPGASTAQQDVINNQDLFIFGFLLIGNIVALLFSSAMVKMFTLEYVLETYASLRSEGPGLYVASITYRFYVFIFGLIADQASIVPRSIVTAARGIHWITVVALPLTFISFYCVVLLRALVRFWTEKPSGVELLGTNVEFVYFIVLALCNGLTLSLYAFAFFPCVTRAITDEEFDRQAELRANALWEAAGSPEGKYRDIEQLARRQIRLRHHML